MRRSGLVLLVLACPALLPAAPAPPMRRPVLALAGGRQPAENLVFEGYAPGPIQRPAPGDFRLTRVADGKTVSLAVADDPADLPSRGLRERIKRLRKAENRLRDDSFERVRLHLDGGFGDARDEKERDGRLDLYGRARLEPGVRYRMTWACRPVGAARATEVSCEFELGR